MTIQLIKLHLARLCSLVVCVGSVVTLLLGSRCCWRRHHLRGCDRLVDLVLPWVWLAGLARPPTAEPQR